MSRSTRIPLVVAALLVIGALTAHAAANQLVVYTYDSFVSWGPANSIEADFEEQHPGVDVVFVAPGSSGEALAKLVSELETGGTTADVFLGISDTQLPRALGRDLFVPLNTELIPNLAQVPTDLHFDETGHIIPLDRGYISLVYNKEALDPADVPTSLDELTNPRYKGKIIAIDARTSSVGHAFLMWTIAKYGDPGFVEYWRRLAPNLLTVAGGWSAAYQHFEAGEAPIVISYSTDTAYGVMYAESDRYRVVTPDGEAYRQIEGVGIVSGTEKPEIAHAFLNYLLSVEVQSQIPTTNWMFPVNQETPLPQEWQAHAVIPRHAVHLDPDQIAENEARWLRQWATEITR